jgi:hypothetical protein
LHARAPIFTFLPSSRDQEAGGTYVESPHQGPPPPFTTRCVRASIYEGTSLLTVHTVDPHTVDRSCTPYI